jgi:hypothetical protein
MQTTEGAAAWRRSRAQGRAELLQAVRAMAISGDTNAQKLLATFVAQDDTQAVADQRITAKDFREIVGLTATAISHRVRAGDMIQTPPDNAYRVGDLVAVLGRMWQELSKARDAISRMEKAAHQAKTDKGEIERQIKAEQLRERKRENDLREHRLLEAGAVSDRWQRLSEAVRDHSKTMAEDIILKLCVPTEAAERVRSARVKFLSQVAAELDRT